MPKKTKEDATAVEAIVDAIAGADVQKAKSKVHREPTPRRKFINERVKQALEEAGEKWDTENPEKKKSALPRTVAALTPEEQSAWVAKQIESLNKRLTELSAIRLGTATA